MHHHLLQDRLQHLPAVIHVPAVPGGSQRRRARGEAVLPPAVFGPYLADILDLDARARSGRLLVAEHAGRVAGTVTCYGDAASEGLG
jgi:hypothetical protein